jgi:IS5 family transposase
MGYGMLHSKIIIHAEQNKEKNNFRFKQLQDLEQEIEWDDLVEAIFPCYVASNIGHVLVTVESMLRIYFLQHRYDMSPSDVEDALFQLDVLREFALIDLDRDVIPNASCIADFNSLLVEKSLALKLEQAFGVQPIKNECSIEF